VRVGARVEPGQWLALDLRAHSLLADVPLHDVWRVDLPGADRACTMPAVRGLLHPATATTGNAAPERQGPAVRALFALRWFLGGLLGWDEQPADAQSWSYRSRLSDEDVSRSHTAPGTLDGPFTLLYEHDDEAVSEIRNATVHAFLASAVAPTAYGHALYFAVYVAPVSRWTNAYMMLIDPFRRWIVYPELMRRVRRAWERAELTDQTQ
jgi:hypothetical protein